MTSLSHAPAPAKDWRAYVASFGPWTDIRHGEAPAELSDRVEYTARDAAWHSGYTATYQSEEYPVRPAADLMGADLLAWLDGQSWALEQIEADRQSAWDAECFEADLERWAAEAGETYRD